MSGWKQAPTGCVHMGLMAAVLTIALHDIGHEWVCDCGKVFVVRRVDGKKTLAER